jgi:hypothetical protein
VCLKVYVQSVAVKSNAFVSPLLCCCNGPKAVDAIFEKKILTFSNPKYTLNISGVCFFFGFFLERFLLSREKERQNTHIKVVNASSLCACTRIIIRDGRKRKEYF